MTIHKLTAGTGYTYLTRQVAGADVQRERGQSAAEYYTAKGNPPGVWAGRGAPLLGIDGQEVTERAMLHLFGIGMHPDADRIIDEYLDAHRTQARSDRAIEVLVRRAFQAATLGRVFPSYEGLEAFETRVAERLARIAAETGRAVTAAETKKVKAEEARRQRAAVAGFDVVFAPVKSAAILWALDERAEVRSTVRAAHEAARTAALDLLEQHAAFTRTGSKGQAQIETHGLIAAVFDHYDSRAGDPNLHTHVAISNKVLGVDGKWRALDARGLYRMTVAASEFYNTRFETELSARLGVTFTARPDTAAGKEPVREIEGIPVAVIEHFSARRTEIEARYGQLVREYRREHGHDPSAGACHKLARQANLDTREGKKAPRSLEEMRADWTQSATEAHGPGIVAQVMAAVPAQTAIPTASTTLDPAEVAARVVANVAEARSTWTLWNLRAEAERLARIDGSFPSGAEHARFVERVVEHATGPDLSIRVDSIALLDEPARLRRSDGTSVFAENAAARYTSALILDAEARLVAAATTPAPSSPLPAVIANAALDRFEAEHGPLDPGQRALALAFATEARQLSVGLGPAGSGKTTAMRAFAEISEAAGRRVIALGTSAASAAVLGEELGVRAENLHKFLWEHAHSTAPNAVRAEFRVGASDVILVDEAGMAGTLNLDRLVKLAAARGATVRLLGDHRQLGAVESGGALRLLVNEAGATELTTLHRFRNPHEADATLKLRDGDASALDFYQQHDRIIGGSREAMIEAAYAGWHRDVLAGKTSLMAAATNQDVSALNTRARADRVAAGHVEAEGVALRDGTSAGTGDWVVTRRNNRQLTACSGRDFVKNGDTWTVTDRREDGALIVKNQSHGGRAVLPADYVSAHVELAYATTVHRAQGSTVDTAHPLITEEMGRENLYVIATRAREQTTLYVATHQVPGLDPDHHVDAVRIDPSAYAAREVLENVITRESAELSATETIRHAQDHAVNLSVLIPNYQYAHQILVPRSAPAEPLGQTPVVLEPARANLPAWLPLVPAETALTRDDHAYLTASAELISMRVEELTEHAIADRPAWTRKLGNAPAHVEERAAWAKRIGTIAAYREQQQIVDDDPHHPTGAHVETNLADYMAYSHAFRAAAELRQAARGRPWSEIDSDVPERPDAQRPGRQRAPRGDTQMQARDRRLEALTPAQRQRIADTAIERRARHARKFEPPIQRQQRQEGSEYRPYLIPPPVQPEHGHGPRIGW